MLRVDPEPIAGSTSHPSMKRASHPRRAPLPSLIRPAATLYAIKPPRQAGYAGHGALAGLLRARLG